MIDIIKNSPYIQAILAGGVCALPMGIVFFVGYRIERKNSKQPSDLFTWLLGSIFVSAVFGGALVKSFDLANPSFYFYALFLVTISLALGWQADMLRREILHFSEWLVRAILRR